MSAHQNREEIALFLGGLAGLILIGLIDFFVLPNFVLLRDIFAFINIMIFLGLLFSPLLLIWGDWDSHFSRAIIALYFLSGFLIGLMIAYLARGDTYLGFVTIPNEISWVVVSIIAALLLIPLVNFFSSFFIGMWLGSLIYYKVYQASNLSKTLIGSPFFLVPLLTLIASEIYRKIHSRQNLVYIFDKAKGSLTRHKPSVPEVSTRKILAVTLTFLAFSSLVAAGCGAWNELEEATIVQISNFRLTAGTTYDNYYLKITFSLVNVRSKTIPLSGSGNLYVFNKTGNPICGYSFPFSEQHFKYDEKLKKWICTLYLPGSILLSPLTSRVKITALPRLVESVNNGHALLKVYINNGKKVLESASHLKSILNVHILMRFYFRNDIATLQAELDKQWPFKVHIYNYFKLGNYSWMVVGRTGGEIIFYPGKMYDWYVLQSTDGGNRWEITWKGDNSPVFRIEILAETEVQITTPYGAFLTRDEGETWERKALTNQ